MPSGSHGGHSHSGGARVGGSSFGGSHSSHGGSWGGYRHRGPIFFHFWGHRYVVPTRYSALISLFAVVMVFSIFFIFGGWLMMSSGQSNMDLVKRDYDRYQVMIADATEANGLLVIGTIENRYYDDDAGKWYLTYSFPTNDGGKINGESYAVYTLAELNQPQYCVNAPIELALDRVPESEYDDVDSIPTDYANMPLERDGAYTTAKNTHKAGSTMLWVACCVLGGSIVLNILIAVTTKKKVATNNNANQTTATETTTATANNGTATAATPVDTDKYCEYCGSKLDTGATKCHLCGARVRK